MGNDRFCRYEMSQDDYLFFVESIVRLMDAMSDFKDFDAVYKKRIEDVQKSLDIFENSLCDDPYARIIITLPLNSSDHDVEGFLNMLVSDIMSKKDDEVDTQEEDDG